MRAGVAGGGAGGEGVCDGAGWRDAGDLRLKSLAIRFAEQIGCNCGLCIYSGRKESAPHMRIPHRFVLLLFLLAPLPAHAGCITIAPVCAAKSPTPPSL